VANKAKDDASKDFMTVKGTGVSHGAYNHASYMMMMMMMSYQLVLK
jgi:hypothetical protein